MKAFILAAGKGARMGTYSKKINKSLLPIENKAAISHIIELFHETDEFVIGLGYKGEVIKKYFSNYHNSRDDWNVHLLDSGIDTQTGGRIKRGMQFAGRERIMVTYGDGVGNINISELLEFHKSHGKLATLTAVRPASRFGEVNFEGDQVIEF